VKRVVAAVALAVLLGCLSGCEGTTFEGLKVENRTPVDRLLHVTVDCPQGRLVDHEFSLQPNATETWPFDRPGGAKGADCVARAESGNLTASEHVFLGVGTPWVTVRVQPSGIDISFPQV